MNTYLKLRIALLIFSSIGFILYIVAIAVPKWATHSTGNNGLWQMCFLNGGVETCSLWADSLKTSTLKIIQILACVGLVFYCLFVVTGAMTIFWTSHWKKAKAIKYSTVVFALLAVIMLAVCVVLYKNDKGSDGNTLAYAWFFTIIATVVAGIAAPFYLVDACRTVAPKKPDKEQFFKNINVPPKPTMAKFDNDVEPDTFKFGNGGRPPLLSELRRQHTTFIHPPPNPANKKLTQKDIKSFPLPPTKTKLNLFDKSEVEDHPAPLKSQIITTNGKNPNHRDEDISSTKSTDFGSQLVDIENESFENHSVFKFHKIKTINKNGKTMLKIQNKSAKLPPVLMVMPGVDENDEEIVDDSQSRRMATKNRAVSQWEQEQMRRKLAPYFVDLEMKNDDENKEKTTEQLQKQLKLLAKKDKQNEKVIKKKTKDLSGIYIDDNITQEPPKKPKKKQKKKKFSRPFSSKSEYSVNSEVETCVNTYDRKESFHQQNGISIYNDIEEEDV